MNNIYIIDPVGCKAGMDLYDYSLASGFDVRHQKVVIVSNFSTPNNSITYKTYFSASSGKGIMSKIGVLLKGLAQILWFLPRNNNAICIIHSFGNAFIDLLLLIVSKKISDKTVVIVHDVEGFAEKKHKGIQQFYFTYLTKYIVFHNIFSKNSFVKNFPNIKNTTFRVIRHGHFIDRVSHQKVNKLEARKALGIADQERICLFFGMIKEVKGLEVLLKSLTQTKSDFKLIIAGATRGVPFDKYQTIINNLELGVKVIKHIRFIPDYERNLFFCASDLVVIPYKKIYQSGVLLLASSYGIPICVSNLEPNLDVITDGFNGLVFESNNVSSLAQKLDAFFQMPSSQIEEMVLNQTKTLQLNYNWEKIAEEYLKLFNV